MRKGGRERGRRERGCGDKGRHKGRVGVFDGEKERGVNGGTESEVN